MQWKTIPGYPNYKVNRNGVVKSFVNPTPRIMKPHVDCHGRVRVSIVGGSLNKQTVMKLHRAVALAFIPNPNNYPLVMHLDSNPKNNKVNNLKWGTASQNLSQAAREGKLGVKGSAHFKSKLTNKQVREIRKNPDGLSRINLAKKFGVSTATICFIVNNKTWRHLL